MAWAASLAGGVMDYLGSQNAAGQAGNLQNSELGLQAQQQQFNQQQITKADSYLYPAMSDIESQALSNGPTRYFDEEKGALEQGLNTARNNIAGRTSADSGASLASLQGVDIEGAKGEASLLQKDNQRKLGMETNLAAMAQGQAGSAAAGMNQAFNTGQNTFGSMASTYMGMAGAGMQDFASNMGQMGSQIYDSMHPRTAAPTVAPPAATATAPIK